MNKYDIAVVIGRFQPFHNGHKVLIQKALSLAEDVLVLVGSANKASDIKNPFTYEERRKMILNSFITEDDQYNPNADVYRIYEDPLKDFMYNDELWVQEVQRIVNIVADGTTRRIVLIGHSKDDSSYYLKMFPQWDFVDIGHVERLNSTDIRELLYDKKSIEYLKGVVPDYVYNFIKLKDMSRLIEEHEFVDQYKKAWASAPYPPTFWTADAVVIQQGHVLVIKRGAMPGKGLWALPGGFVNQQEFTKDAAIRELREETKLKVPEPVLRGSIVAEKVFDAPGRSLRGRTITQAFLIHLTNVDQGLPKVKGSDDAAEAKWIPLAELKEEEFFEDHFHIIQDLLGKL